LAGEVAELSRGRLQALLKQGAVTIDDRVASLREPVRGGERIIVRLPDSPVDAAPAQNIGLSVLYADEHLVIVDKPSGLVVHPGAGNPSGTLMNGLLHHYPELAKLPRAGIVHRLDKDTTGVMVVARTLHAHKMLVEAISARSVKREYVAVVQGLPTGGGKINAPIGRDPRSRTRMAVVAGGRHAVTHFRVEERYPRHAALAIQLETGRTHQIRVHLAHLGYPIVGDTTYSGRARRTAGLGPAAVAAVNTFTRQALHARRLSFDHPIDASPCAFEASLPSDVVALMSVLRADGSAATES
jgi:23S rRNA pseudouridine1911/1915/1917 synthase